MSLRKYLILLIISCLKTKKFCTYKGGTDLKRFEFWLPLELFKRIKLMANFFNKPISKMMIELLEIGYIHKLGGKVE